MKTVEQTAKTLALDTANTAVRLASDASKIATDLASKTAETTTEIKTNMIWMMKSLEGIEMKLNEMDKSFVTAAQHADVVKELADHETRLNVLEDNKTTLGVKLTIGISILTLLTSLLVWHIMSK